MENATKALLIAAAILIAILVISLGIVVYTMAAETVEGINMSGQEVSANNEKFTRYNGEHQRGSQVNAMLKTVLSANNEARANDEDAKLVTVYNATESGGTITKGTTILSTSTTNLTTSMPTSSLYNVVVNYGGTGGLVDEIYVILESSGS